MQNKTTVNKAKIHYYDIGDYLSREEKLKIIKEFGTVSNVPWKKLKPNQHGDWINQRNESFNEFIPIQPEKKFDLGSKSFFTTYSLGIASARDAWVYNSSRTVLLSNMQRMAEFYDSQRQGYQKRLLQNRELEFSDFISNDSTKISWNDSLKKSCESNKILPFQKDAIVVGGYRPFFKMHLSQSFQECIVHYCNLIIRRY